MSLRYSYLATVHPPAPFVYVSVGRPDGSAVSDVPAQLDTGAYKTVVPLHVAERAGLDRAGEVRAGGLHGSVATLPVFRAVVAIKGCVGHEVEVLASPEEPVVLLGRDVLNHHRILLDGPNLRLEIG